MSGGVQHDFCMLFADVSGSVTLFENVGNSSAKRLISECIALMGKITEEHSGKVVNKHGDEILACFHSVDDAFDAAVKIQREHAMGSISVRIGFNSGPVIEEDGEYYGDAVNVASRVVNKASGGEALTTGECVRALSVDRIPQVRHIDTNAVKGRQELVEIFEIIWQDDEVENQTTLGTILPSGTGEDDSITIRLCYRDRRYEYNGSTSELRLGREPSNDIISDNPRASRKHATIERRGRKFILTDHSTNGTYFVNSNGESTLLKRETTEIFGSGKIGLGSHPDEDYKSALKFACYT